MEFANEYSLCVLPEERRYFFYIKTNDLFCKLGACSNDVSEMYKKCFEFLYKKFCFENNVLSKISVESLSSRDLLKLYGYFILNYSLTLKEIEKKSKSK